VIMGAGLIFIERLLPDFERRSPRDMIHLRYKHKEIIPRGRCFGLFFDLSRNGQ